MNSHSNSISIHMKICFPTSDPIGKTCTLLGLLCTLGIGATRLSAQSLSSGAFQSVEQSSVSNFDYAQNYNNSSTGAPVSASYTQSFTGMDGAGKTQTMTFNGTSSGSATYGQLHCAASGTVTNTYYNASNPTFIDPAVGPNNPAGSPDGFASTSISSFTDTLQYGGALQAGYQALYIFHVDGTNNGFNPQAALQVTIAGNSPEDFFATQSGFNSDDFATMEYAINGQSPQSITVQLDARFQLGTQNVADGSTLSGDANFSDTATLAGIEIVDANGNPVSGVTVTTASGTPYDVVPEPKTFVFVLSAAVLFIIWRGKNRAVKQRPA